MAGDKLTAFGEPPLAHPRAAIGHREAIQRNATSAIGEAMSSVRTTAFPTVFATVPPPLQRRFRNLHRGAILIGPDAWIGVLPAGHRLGRRAPISPLPISLADLTAETLVLATGECCARAGMLVRTKGLSLADIRMELPDWT